MTCAPVQRLFPIPTASSTGALALPPLILGAGVFGYDYNTDDTLQSKGPEDTLRRCFQYGINTLDTSPYYTCSEEVLGKAFAGLKDEFNREDYQIITKIGRYGRTKAEFDYSKERV
jgi:D-arabinose 1-dehydrogenase